MCNTEIADLVGAHPRSRGENLQAQLHRHVGNGSSPLTRGKRDPARTAISGGRLIPAHAGKTRPACLPSRPWPAHPRSRGENHAVVTSLQMPAGSSPLTRGKLCVFKIGDAGARLIPAHAGKTFRAPPGIGLVRAHPRSRGENTVTSASGRRSPGSSPLTRGKLELTPVYDAARRLIPAHAGKTLVLPRPARIEAAHPRSRGENHSFEFEGDHAGGSSPLTRGKLQGRRSLSAESGLIPAHAGKTSQSPSPRPPREAHPRSRGEN